MHSAEPDHDVRTLTLEAFADTIIPGEKRHPEDRAVAGVSTGGGAVAAGAVPILETPEGGMEGALDDLAVALNGHARAYCASHDLEPDPALPFVGLSYDHRTALVQQLVSPDHPEKMMWVGVAMFSYMAFDTGAHMHTTEALAAGHPGLRTLGFADPDEDGLWRFPQYSYGRQLADIHPDTDATGSPS
ncbi:regulator [Actinospica durhamensis]|uniref:Regulator n=1 Tax=Actinospica durhamensis TaxID=1508375 RepID=A0A941EI92_9ACTN|nr:DUF5987 family protein [Actinospica durhamensis]MBR7831977.1 regulator [Actinospica durhamensis]